MSLLKGIGLSLIKPNIWQLEAMELALKSNPNDLLSTPKIAVQELAGVSDGLQSFLLKRAFNLLQSEGLTQKQETFF